MVTSFEPLLIYLYDNGLVRLASNQYSKGDLKNKFAHLTNYSINKHSNTFQKNDDPMNCEGHKWTLKALLSRLRKEHGDSKIEKLWAKIQDIVIKTFLSIEAHVNTLVMRNCKSKEVCFEIFGVDVLVDQDLKPWLIEVNISPSLNQNSKLDFYVKEGMVVDALNLAGFKVPSGTRRLSNVRLQSGHSSYSMRTMSSATTNKTLIDEYSELKSVNRMKRTKYVSRWNEMNFMEKISIIEDLKIVMKNL